MTFNAEIIVFVVYLVFMLGIGVHFFFRSKGGGDKAYFLGGRQMGPWVSALSAGASDMSAWVLMGLPASIYAALFASSLLLERKRLVRYWGMVMESLDTMEKLRRRGASTSQLTV